MNIRLTSVLVEDQEKAFKFYTQILGFVLKTDVPVGEYKWLTIVSEDDPGGTELLLEPTGIAPAKVYQKALFEAGIPLTAFHVNDIDMEYERLSDLGVKFSMKPNRMGPVKLAVFDDTCGNNIQLIQVMDND
ncbi:MAG: VOC family protein [Chitinophagaceae bacterium]|nr:VOC family protein [Chitinophagaceae bacterium]